MLFVQAAGCVVIDFERHVLNDALYTFAGVGAFRRSVQDKQYFRGFVQFI